MKKAKNIFNNIVDCIFYFVYIVLLLISILDLLGVTIPFIDKYINDSNQLQKFILLVFACVGIIVLNDKRTLEKRVVDPIEDINENIRRGLLSNNNIFYFVNKKENYNFFAREIRGLPDGAEVLVTSFDKNQSTNYYKGEDKHTEALMDDYTRMIQSGNIRVKQMVHVCTKKEYIEVQDRIKLYGNCNNYALSAMVGLPIRPYIDFVIINKEIVMLSFSNDKTAPYNEAFSFAIRNAEIASQFERYFDIYWNNDCRVIKGNDGINQNNLLWLEELALDEIVDVPEYTEYKALLLKLIICLKEFGNLKNIITKLHILTCQKSYFKQREKAKMSVDNLCSYIRKEIMEGAINVTWSESRAIFTDVSTYVKRKILSVMVIKANSYWEADNRVEEFENELMKMGDDIQREQILVLSSEDLAKNKKLLQEEKKAGVQLNVIIDEDIQNNKYKDFIIVDDDMIINLLDNDMAESIIEDKKIKEYNSYFVNIKLKASKNF